MDRLFAYDGPLAQGLEALLNQVIANLLALVCCVPILTIGASVTALHATSSALREGSVPVIRTFFRAFRTNFRQSTVLWMITLGGLLLLGTAFWSCLQIGGLGYYILEIILLLEAFFVLLLLVWVFPLQARYENSLRQTLRNAALLAVSSFFPGILMLFLYLLPFVIPFILPDTLPIVLLFCLSLPTHVCASIYNRVFQRAEVLQQKHSSPPDAS